MGPFLAKLRFLLRQPKLPLQEEPMHRFLQLNSTESKALWSRGICVMDELVRSTQAGLL